jgi:hypothetical protein
LGRLDALLRGSLGRDGGGAWLTAGKLAGGESWLAAGELAGEKHLRGLQEKMRRDERAGAREVPGVMIAVRTLWFDARIEAAVGNLGGAPQVVLLGAGSCIHEMRCFITTNSKFRATSIQCFLISTMHIQRTRSCLL